MPPTPPIAEERPRRTVFNYCRASHPDEGLLRKCPNSPHFWQFAIALPGHRSDSTKLPHSNTCALCLGGAHPPPHSTTMLLTLLRKRSQPLFGFGS
jgi:hypothetical protein